jgi:L-fuconate dehydratase
VLRFGVPVCPHAGGVGLCEYVIHLRYIPFHSRLSFTSFSPLMNEMISLIDYIAVSGTMERNVLEFVDHLHEHFVTPCSINENGRYNVPTNPHEGYRCVVHSPPLSSPPSFAHQAFLLSSCLTSTTHHQSIPPPSHFVRSSLTFGPSIEMHKSSIAEFEWPHGSYWVGAAKANK